MVCNFISFWMSFLEILWAYVFSAGHKRVRIKKKPQHMSQGPRTPADKANHVSADKPFLLLLSLLLKPRTKLLRLWEPRTPADTRGPVRFQHGLSMPEMNGTGTSTKNNPETCTTYKKYKKHTCEKKLRSFKVFQAPLHNYGYNRLNPT